MDYSYFISFISLFFFINIKSIYARLFIINIRQKEVGNHESPNWLDVNDPQVNT